MVRSIIGQVTALSLLRGGFDSRTNRQSPYLPNSQMAIHKWKRMAVRPRYGLICLDSSVGQSVPLIRERSVVRFHFLAPIGTITYFISFQRLGQSLYKNLPIYRTGGAMVAHQPHKLETGFESHACTHKKAHTAIFFKKGNQSNGRTQILRDLQNRFESDIIFLTVPCICLCSLRGLSTGLKNQRMVDRYHSQAPEEPQIGIHITSCQFFEFLPSFLI